MRARPIFAAALAIGILGAPDAAEAAKVCKLQLTGPTVKSHPTRITAEAAAVAVWSTRTARIFTARYANWQNAENRRFSCSRYTTVIGINAWRCRAVANPCALR